MINRRELLLRGASVLPIVAVAACSSLKITATAIQADAQALLNFASGALSAALGLAGIKLPAGVVGDFNTALNGIAANAQELLDAVGNNAMPILQRIMTGLKFVADVLTPFFPLAGVAYPIFYTLISGAVALVQGWISSFQPAPAASFMMAAPAVRGLIPMTMDQARKALGE
jgi:hypothetical protein